MKTIKSQIENMITKVTDKIDCRETTFDLKSEKWQDSERGFAHSEKTEELDEVLSNLEMTLESIINFIN